MTDADSSKHDLLITIAGWPIKHGGADITLAEVLAVTPDQEPWQTAGQLVELRKEGCVRIRNAFDYSTNVTQSMSSESILRLFQVKMIELTVRENESSKVLKAFRAEAPLLAQRQLVAMLRTNQSLHRSRSNTENVPFGLVAKPS